MRRMERGWHCLIYLNYLNYLKQTYDRKAIRFILEANLKIAKKSEHRNLETILKTETFCRREKMTFVSLDANRPNSKNNRANCMNY